MMPEVVSNSNVAPGSLPGGDGYNPWASGAPPAGAPPQTYIGPGGQTINIPPGQSQFMQEIPAGCTMTPSGLLLCPVTPTPTPRQSPTPRPPANSNTATTPVPDVKPTATPAKTPAVPARTPNVRPPASNKPTETGDSLN